MSADVRKEALAVLTELAALAPEVRLPGPLRESRE